MGFCLPTGARVFVLGLLAQVGISACGISLPPGDGSPDAGYASLDAGDASRYAGSCRLDTEATRIMEGTVGVVDCGSVEADVPLAQAEAFVSCMRTELNAMRPVRGEVGEYGRDSPYRNIYVARTLDGVYRWTQIGAEGDGPTFRFVYTYRSSTPLELRAFETRPGLWRVRNPAWGNVIPGPLPPDGPYAPPQLVPHGQICPPPG